MSLYFGAETKHSCFCCSLSVARVGPPTVSVEVLLTSVFSAKLASWVDVVVVMEIKLFI